MHTTIEIGVLALGFVDMPHKLVVMGRTVGSFFFEVLDLFSYAARFFGV